MAVLNTGLAKTSAGGFTIPYSCRFDQASSSHLTWTPSATQTNTKIGTWSLWTKKTEVIVDNEQSVFNSRNASGAAGFTNLDFHYDDNENSLLFSVNDAGGNACLLVTTAEYRDPSAWYHIVIAYDSTQEVAANRVKIYVNGEQVTSFSSETYPPEDKVLERWAVSGIPHNIGANPRTSNRAFYDGYLAEFHYIDGTAYDADDFGETGDYGEWKPKEVSGLTYGNNGFYLDFADSADLGDDESGEGNDWAEVNIDAADQMLDTPTNNFCTLNPLDNISVHSLSEGNLKAGAVPANNDKQVWSTFGFTSGKWYVEIHLTLQGPESHYTGSGVFGSPIGFSDTQNDGYLSSGGNYATFRTGNGLTATSGTNNSNNTAGVTGDILTIAVDADIGSVWFGKDAAPDTSTTANVTGLSTTPVRDYRFGQQEANSSPGSTMTWNFGQDSSFAGEETAQGNADGNGYGDFYYTPPSGFLALCTANLDTPAVIPSEHFNTVLYDGDGTTSNAITGVGFQPDFVWLKTMSAASTHRLYDTVRGVAEGSSTHLTGADITEDTFVSFDADGFTVKEHAVDGNHTNDDGDNFVAWNWKAASTASGTTTGSGTGKAYSAVYNTDAGFSMVTYLGNDTAGHTIPHHLSKAPEWFMIKAREHTDPWCLFHHNLHPSTPELYADEMNAVASFGLAPTYWNDTAPTSSVFTVGSSNNVNLDDEGYMAYCFHSVEGYSKVGTYEGNDDADGTFVYTGFRPAYVWIKNIDASSNWVCHDTTRNTYNPSTKRMVLNLAAIERTDLYGILDFTSNGFKLRDGDNLTNEETYIYYAVAETPFKYANAR